MYSYVFNAKTVLLQSNGIRKKSPIQTAVRVRTNIDRLLHVRTVRCVSARLYYCRAERAALLSITHSVDECCFQKNYNSAHLSILFWFVRVPFEMRNKIKTNANHHVQKEEQCNWANSNFLIDFQELQSIETTVWIEQLWKRKKKETNGSHITIATATAATVEMEWNRREVEIHKNDEEKRDIYKLFSDSIINPTTIWSILHDSADVMMANMYEGKKFGVYFHTHKHTYRDMQAQRTSLTKFFLWWFWGFEVDFQVWGKFLH